MLTALSGTLSARASDPWHRLESVVFSSGEYRNLEEGRRKTMYQPRRHLSQMHTVNCVPFIRGKGDFLKKKLLKPIGGGSHPRPPAFESVTGR